MFNMNNMMKQAQMLQERMAKAQEEAAALECTGESGAGLVKVTVNGRHEVRRVEEESKAVMSKVTAGIPLPPGMKLPF